MKSWLSNHWWLFLSIGVVIGLWILFGRALVKRIKWPNVRRLVQKSEKVKPKSTHAWDDFLTAVVVLSTAVFVWYLMNNGRDGLYFWIVVLTMLGLCAFIALISRRNAQDLAMLVGILIIFCVVLPKLSKKRGLPEPPQMTVTDTTKVPAAKKYLTAGENIVLREGDTVLIWLDPKGGTQTEVNRPEGTGGGHGALYIYRAMPEFRYGDTAATVEKYGQHHQQYMNLPTGIYMATTYRMKRALLSFGKPGLYAKLQ